MLKCEDATKFASDGLDRRLNARETIGLRLHLLACDKCRNFSRQIRMISRMSRHFATGKAEDDAASD
ncbi:zf-HC2 domain-containing protein [Rhizobium sp. SL42]|uniref:zf-HC2 domain-containing protein n=1 Tax=Rhizobium sp. SL42 TaxID=2806346 RepID=UPI001F354C90|nr:zf-HC2 domain-containing protein [Rhizobium sp. SL42]UJW74856.1 zf-HC2 domain-containing protein [Rhizobium sp. SL42]